MVRDQQVPSLVLRQVCDSVIDNLGEKSLRMLCTQAGLQRYYSGGELPPADSSPSLTVDELSGLFAAAYRIFGDRGMRPILLRSGRSSAQHFRETNQMLIALAGAAFKVLPADARIKLILARSAKMAEEMLHAPHRTYDTPEGYVVEVRECPYCAGTRSEQHICHFPVGFYADMLRWATGATYAVSEVACMAAGAPACVFQIGRQPQG